MQKPFHVENKFSKSALQMRGHFDRVFSDAKSADSGERFVWDYWHVPGQYTHLRTPAYHFFPKKLYEAFHNELVWWGRRNLGCHDISPTWLSCYVDGCKQELHGDLPHGPWAFVFSLTNWRGRGFSGGETQIMREEILSYWRNISGFNGLERDKIFHEVAPEFNRLVVFDPRIPHGVKEVRGVQDPCAGRLVVHGWFVNPRPFIEGPLPTAELQEKIESWLGGLGEEFQKRISAAGLLSVHFGVSATGAVGKVRVLSNRLQSREAIPQESQNIARYFLTKIRATKFRPRSKPSRVTLPVVFGEY